MEIEIRKAQDEDAALVIAYLKKLAEYEKLSDVCNITKDALLSLLNEPNGLNAVIAEADGVPAGFMTYYFYKIATFSGKKIIPAGPIIRNKDEKENTHRIYTLIILSLDDSGNILSTS